MLQQWQLYRSSLIKPHFVKTLLLHPSVCELNLSGFLLGEVLTLKVSVIWS